MHFCGYNIHIYIEREGHESAYTWERDFFEDTLEPKSHYVEKPLKKNACPGGDPHRSHDRHTARRKRNRSGTNLLWQQQQQHSAAAGWVVLPWPWISESKTLSLSPPWLSYLEREISSPPLLTSSSPSSSTSSSYIFPSPLSRILSNEWSVTFSRKRLTILHAILSLGFKNRML